MTPTSNDTLQYLERLTVFEDISNRERAMLATVMQPRGLQTGEVLCREGDAARSFYVTVHGVIEVWKDVGSGREELLSRVGANNFLGQLALIDRQPRSATLKAGSTALVLECAAEAFDRLFWAGTPFAYRLMDKIVTHLAHRLRDADRELYDLFSNPQRTLLKLHEAAIEVARLSQDSDLNAESRGY